MTTDEQKEKTEEREAAIATPSCATCGLCAAVRPVARVLHDLISRSVGSSAGQWAVGRIANKGRQGGVPCCQRGSRNRSGRLAII